MNQKILAIIIVVLVASLVVAGVVIAASVLWSNPVTVTPQLNPTPTPTPTPSPSPSPSPTPIVYTLNLDVNTTTPFIGEAIKLTATITPITEGVTVTFYKNNVLIAESGATTNAGGVAEYVTPTITGITPKVYNATCTIP